MKKLVTALAALFTVVMCGVSAQAFNTLVNDDFESGTLEVYSPTDESACEIVKEGGNSYARINRNGVILQKSFAASTGRISIDIDAYGSPEAVFRIIELYDSSGAVRALALQSGYGKVFTKSTPDGADVRNPVDLTKWHHYRLIVDYESKTFDVYIDYELLTQGRGFCQGNPQNLGRIKIYADKEGGAFDNLRVAELNSIELDEKILEAEIMMKNKKCGYSAGEYPQSAFVMLSDKLSEITERSADENLTGDEAEQLAEELSAATDDFLCRAIEKNSDSQIFYDDFEACAENSELTGDYTVNKNVFVKKEGESKAAVLENSGAAARLIKRLSEPVSGLIEESFRFMQPAAFDITQLWTVSDYSGKKVAAELYTADGKIYFRNRDGNDAEICGYRSGEWYRVKLVLDTKNQTADIYINGELAAEKIVFMNETDSISRLFEIRLMNEGQLYIDDIDICYSTSGGSVNHIIFGDVSQIIATGGFSGELNVDVAAEAYDKAGNPCAADMEYILMSAPDGVSLNGNVLTAARKTEGTAVIKAAESGGIYNILSVHFIDSAQVMLLDIKTEDGCAIIKGEIANPNSFDVIIELKGDYTDVSEKAELKETESGKAAFEVRIPINQSEKTQFFTLKISGEGIYERTESFSFFGADADERFLKKINNADKNAVGAILDKYADYIEINSELYKNYEDEICSGIAAAGSFSGINEFKSFLRELEAFYAVKSATRENVKSLFEQYADVYLLHGLTDKYNSLSEKKKNLFYTKSIGVTGSSLSEVCSNLNAIIKEITAEESKSSGGGGGSVGRGGISKPDYSVTPVKPSAAEDADNEYIEPFADIQSAKWAEDALLYMKKTGAMTGTNNYANPNDSITRAEMIKLAVCAFSFDGGKAVSFSDSYGEWWSGYAASAAEAGIASGYPDGSFRGNSRITREDSAVILSRIIEKKNITLYESNADGLFSDESDISDYALSAVREMKSFGILSGIGENLFAPKKNVTRAEAAQMIYNIIKKGQS